MSRRKLPTDGRAVTKQIEEAAVEEARANYERRAHRYRASASEWKSLASLYLRELELIQSRFDALASLHESELEPRVVIEPTRSGASESVACLVVSDLHVEEEVKPASVQGRNRYNLEIAETRMDTLWRNTVKLIDGARANTNIHRCVLFLMGDLYSGHIHEELRETTLLSPIKSIEWLQPRLISGINYLLKHVKKLDVICKIGNHSRITFKQHLSNPEDHSLEWLLYLWLQSYFQTEKRVTFNIAPAYHTYVNILGVSVRAHHGDAFRYAGGVGGIQVPMNLAISRWNQAEVADQDVMGHWHKYTPGTALINGSLIGYGPLSVRFRSGFEPPQQAFFVVSGKHRRVTQHSPVLVE